VQLTKIHIVFIWVVGHSGYSSVLYSLSQDYQRKSSQPTSNSNALVTVFLIRQQDFQTIQT
jgi:hypothetical protein